MNSSCSNNLIFLGVAHKNFVEWFYRVFCPLKLCACEFFVGPLKSVFFGWKLLKNGWSYHFFLKAQKAPKRRQNTWKKRKMCICRYFRLKKPDIWRKKLWFLGNFRDFCREKKLKKVHSNFRGPLKHISRSPGKKLCRAILWLFQSSKTLCL